MTDDRSSTDDRRSADHRSPIAAAGPPPGQGLYDPQNERDACGIGFVAHIKGERSHDTIGQALTLLENLSHRGAAGCDPCTGDGAGLLLQLPHAFLRRACAALGIVLPAPGRYGVGMLFLPGDAADRSACERALERIVAEEGQHFLGWRDVPTDDAHLGPLARGSRPAIRQAFIASDGLGRQAFERKLYVIRRRFEHTIATSDLRARHECYVASLSAATIVYKGLLLPEQLPRFYRDLADPAVVTALALVHSRFATNTFPTWARAHPYRYLCHNGEINTLKGNVNWMRVREARMRSRRFGDDLPKLFPVIDEDQSDSACLDNALELLVMGGRPLPHVLMMLIPEAWAEHEHMDPDRRAFYEYHAALMEPWDGPAAVAFTDGTRIGATLDRNGLRPARWLVTCDDLVVLASEAGALPFPADQIRAKGRLQPGKMFLVDTAKGRIVDDDEIKRAMATRRPYREWVDAHARTLDALAQARTAPRTEAATLRQRQRLFGYTDEELRMVLAPMAMNGEEPVGSMGTDTPLAVLSEEPQLLFNYFKQLFAQVTNPPIDPIREQLVMSLAMPLGPIPNLLGERPEDTHRIWASSPVLTDAELDAVRTMADPRLRCATLEMSWPVGRGVSTMTDAVESLCRQAEAAVRDGCTILILSDRGARAERAPIPSLLGIAAVHHYLIRAGVRTGASLIVETAEARDVSHIALLVGYGAAAVNPYLGLETVADMVRDGVLLTDTDAATAQKKYVKAIGKGLLKVFSKMGISTAQSYCGAQIFEAIGLGRELIERHFTGTASRIGGIGMESLAEDVLRRHAQAFDTGNGQAFDAHRAQAFSGGAAPRRLESGGEYHYRAQGEHHNWNPATIATLQHATHGASYTTFKEFSRLANDESRRRSTLRGLLELDIDASVSVPLDEVEPAAEIVKRFCTGAMSFGSISREAHETLAIAMNRIGGRSNSGEGGEEPERYGTERGSAIKQVASGRFGVTTEYLVSAKELQIKMAQGAKPGEGGQLPGHKVDDVIARTRYSTPGVTLISPPPHHDIYSIEDLAQLISDLKNVNPDATIAVKLVAEVGVGTVAAGVAKAHADLILISGDSGGTGASPLSSIKHAGIPWELGLAETQQTLVLNELRGRVRVQTDGQLKTGRDVVIAALLGAEEFGFSTAPLIVEGCIMMRKCHLNTCPVGIATQDPLLREKFAGRPEHVINYFFFVAEEVRELMAQLGFRTVNEMVGRSDRLRPVLAHGHRKARTLDLAPLLHRPELAKTTATHCVQAQEHALEDALDHTLIRIAHPALESGAPVQASFAIRNTHRTVGAMLSGEIARRYGREGLPDDTIRFHFTGSAGQSFGAFCTRGVSLTLEGEANDYVGKGLSGGRIVVYPPRESLFIPEETILIGNTALYGATSGEGYFHGRAGERFAVRNSGATAVIEGVGDHGCEYMTGGVVVVLGSTGENFAAGMSGGVAFVLSDDGDFERRCNPGLVELGSVREPHDVALLERLIARHASYTGSARARHILQHWPAALSRFVRVMPVEYRKALERRRVAVAGTAQVSEVVANG